METISNLQVNRCPHCNVAKPQLANIWVVQNPIRHDDGAHVYYSNYMCTSCHEVVLVRGVTYDDHTLDGELVIWPKGQQEVDDSVPDRARELLEQVGQSLHTPDASILVCASALQAMLEEKGLKTGSLNERIDKAAEKQLITQDMKRWAHQIRLESNDARHLNRGDRNARRKEADQCFEFALALAEFLFVLPSRVTRGIEAAEKQPGDSMEGSNQS